MGRFVLQPGKYGQVLPPGRPRGLCSFAVGTGRLWPSTDPCLQKPGRKRTSVGLPHSLSLLCGRTPLPQREGAERSSRKEQRERHTQPATAASRRQPGRSRPRRTSWVSAHFPRHFCKWQMLTGGHLSFAFLRKSSLPPLSFSFQSRPQILGLGPDSAGTATAGIRLPILFLSGPLGAPVKASLLCEPQK